MLGTVFLLEWILFNFVILSQVILKSKFFAVCFVIFGAIIPIMSAIKPKNRTDLASELVRPRSVRLNEHVTRTDVTLDEEAAKALGKPVGRYTTVSGSAVLRGEREYYPRLVRALADAVREFVQKPETCLIVGLGNPSMTADALGSAVVKRITVTRSPESGGVCTLCPSVSGVTGVESFDVISGVTGVVKPSLVIAVDSLCAASGSRLASAFQITDTGIAPGSGVGNHRFRLDRATLGCPVIGVGVPLVVYASTMIREAGAEPSESDLIVTPKDVDLIVEDCAAVIAAALNKALGND
ncbi:MAG TPA: GPR endopeptidase [Clostridiales bacterium]|nr:GPR endopeptidase [Clostridiales bacterium]